MNDPRSAERQPVRGMVRQGDVLLVPVDVPVEAELPSPDGEEYVVFLAAGERTGHAHVVRGQARTASTATADYIVVDGPATLVHDEHDPIALAPGAYEVRRQRQWAPEDDWTRTGALRWVDD